ncbi:methyl-accepting chemotaxis protein [Pseudomonas oryzae]|uniref:Methyl-accepting chemotaxis sensory transducer with Cache sensor n=1 Tax=Pseudomonas oryzae TaxID=1392877 RepID=A0A1H1NRS7_9PSED|nr:methyl-accepting chemotaxis protein [Pseudomonas oryzae]SDS01658.1 methyl-accepting chemotaxis sensory transducer with Cache sensor [Pseudomonas oryzae]
MRNLTTSQKLWGTLIAAWLAMLVLMFWSSWVTRSVMFDERKAKVESQVAIALSVISDVAAQVQRGGMSLEQGQLYAGELIKSMRYDDGRGYFFVFDDSMVVAHPTIPTSTSVEDFKDADGRHLFVEMAQAVKKAGESAFVDYRWKHANGTELENKRSFVRSFEPWGWYIGTGTYIADINEMFVQKLIRAALGLLLAGIPLSLLMGWVIRDLLQRLGGDPRYAVAVARQIAEGDLSQAPLLRAGDTQSLLVDMNRMRESLSRTIGDISHSAREVHSEAEAISFGNAELAARTEQQAAALAETASTMEQLTSTVRQNAENADQARRLAANCADNARKGGSAMEQVVDAMNAIQSSATQMSSIVDTIDAIAFQTNILALNASVEAARAGEQGRGFAVVAGEVRKLASRSAEAAHEIKGLIDGAGGQVRNGNERVRQTGEVIRNMVADMGRLNTLIGEISSASAEQSNGIEQVNVAVAQMDQMTQRNAGMVQDSALAAQRLSKQSARLSEHVVRFVIGGDSAAPRARAESGAFERQPDGVRGEAAWS